MRVNQKLSIVDLQQQQISNPPDMEMEDTGWFDDFWDAIPDANTWIDNAVEHYTPVEGGTIDEIKSQYSWIIPVGIGVAAIFGVAWLLSSAAKIGAVVKYG